MPPRPEYVVAYVPRRNQILGIAYGFSRRNVNLPRGQLRLDEQPLDALARVMLEQTRVRPLEAHLLLRVAEGGEPTSFYYVTRFEGRPLPTPLGRAIWASEAQLLQPTSEGAGWARKVLTLLRRVQG
jgi:ADP-ribose pyrophosphatase YjhB (NUDIX family)